MKRITIITVFMLLIAASVSAGNFGGKKFYINPGHGGHDSDDRPTPLPLGVEMFYESDGNLTRGKHLGNFIKANGGAYKISRTTNTTADDLPLSTIAAQSNSYGGYFMSLHSNGANASANYMVGFFRSSSTAKTTETISGSKAMTEQAVKWHDDTKLTNVTYATARALGDYSFYGYNLGVLRTNSRPGYLMESWFHDYRPEGLRMKSSKYNRFLAWQLCRALMVKPGATTATMKGCIVGDIRNTAKSCGYTNYTSRGRDTYLAINGAKVTLTNSAGTQVASMTTDNCCNGFYAFFDLDPGTYTVKVTKSGYASKSASVTVADNKSTLKNFSISEGADTGISAASAKDFGTVVIGQSKTVSVTVTGAGLSAAIAVASNNSLFTVDQTSLAKTGGTLKITYTPTAVGASTGKVTLTSGSQKATISLTATGKNPVLALSAGWRYGHAANAKLENGKVPGDWLPDANWNLLRNMDYGNGKLYVVNAKGGEIYVLNAQTCELITKLQMPADVVKDGTYTVMDVKVKGSKIFACNLTTDETMPTKIYQWDNDYANPVCILSTLKRGSVARLGDTFDIDGNLTSGRFLFVGKNPSTGNHKIITYAITDGKVATTPVNYGVKSDDGKYIDLGSSPRVVTETNGRFWVMGSAIQPTLLGDDGIATKSINTAALDDVVAGNDFVRFNFKGDSYAFATTYAKKGSTFKTDSQGTTVTVAKAGSYGMMTLLDGNDGWASASKVKNYPAYGMGPEPNTYYSTSCCVKVHKDAAGNAYAVEAWGLVSKQGLQYFKYCDSGKSIPKPTILAEPAADVSTDVTDADANFGKVEIGKSVSRKVNVTGTKLYSDIKVSIGTGGSYQENFSITPASIKYDPSTLSAQGTVTVTYAPVKTGSHYINLRFDVTDFEGTSQKFSVRFNGEGIENSSENPDPVDPTPTDPDDPITGGDTEGPTNDDISDLYEYWNFSTTAGTAANAPWLELDIATKAYTRDIAVAGNKLYALNCRPYGTPVITLVDATKGTEISKLDVTGISGGLIPAASIAVLGDKLIMSNAAQATGVGNDATTDVLRIYRWNSDSEAPELWFEDATHGKAHFGEHMTVQGDMTVGTIFFCDGYKVFAYQVNDGTVSPDPEVIVLSKEDKALAFHTLNNGMVHVAANGENGLWLNGKDAHPYLFDLNGEYLSELDKNLVGGSVGGTSVTAFKFGKRSYVASSAYLENAASGTKSLTGGVLSLVDATDGKYTARMVVPNAGLGEARNTTFASRVAHTITKNGSLVNLYVLTPAQGVARYSFDGNSSTGIGEVSSETVLDARIVNGRVILSDSVADVRIFNVGGALIASGKASVENISLDHGVYIICLQGTDGSVKALKTAF